MKAEHRKELETNALADRVGRIVTKVRTNPRRRTSLYIVGSIAFVVFLFIVVRYFQSGKTESSKNWELLDVGSREAWEYVRSKAPGSPQANAFRFQVAWYQTWSVIQEVGKGPFNRSRDPEEKGKFVPTLKLLDEVEQVYKGLSKDCEGDPIWQPEALYHLAVIEETRAVGDIKALDEARRKYSDLAKNQAFKDSAYAKMAARRAEQLEPDSKSLQKIENLYRELQTRLHFDLLNKLPPQMQP